MAFLAHDGAEISINQSNNRRKRKMYSQEQNSKKSGNKMENKLETRVYINGIRKNV